MTYSIVEGFGFYPACYSAIASTSELSSERVKSIYINPLLGISIYSLLRARRASLLHPWCKNLQNIYKYPQVSTNIHKVTHRQKTE